MWYVGLDLADTHHDVEVQDEGGLRVGECPTNYLPKIPPRMESQFCSLRT